MVSSARHGEEARGNRGEGKIILAVFQFIYIINAAFFVMHLGFFHFSKGDVFEEVLSHRIVPI